MYIIGPLFAIVIDQYLKNCGRLVILVEIGITYDELFQYTDTEQARIGPKNS
jgi:hypothetical protein